MTPDICFLVFAQVWPNLEVNSGVHPTLNGNYHHHIIVSKFNLMTEYPPPYEQLVWVYKKANIYSIQKALNKSVHQQDQLLVRSAN